MQTLSVLGELLDELAGELGVSTDKLEDAFRELRPRRPFHRHRHRGTPPHPPAAPHLAEFLADRFNLSVDEVEDALDDARPPARPLPPLGP